MRRKRQRSLSRSGSLSRGRSRAGRRPGWGRSRRGDRLGWCAGPARPRSEVRRRTPVVARGPRRSCGPRRRGGRPRSRPRPAACCAAGLGRRVRLAGHRLRLEAGHVLDARERQQLPGLGRVEEPVGLTRRPRRARAQRDRGDPVAVGLGGHRRVLEQDVRRPAAVRREHRLEHRERDARLVAEPRHEAGARVELRRQPAPRRSAGSGAVVRADAVAQRAVGRGDAEPLDPGVLVGRHGLAGELAADPVGRLGQHDRAPGPPRPARRRPRRARRRRSGRRRGARTGGANGQAGPGSATIVEAGRGAQLGDLRGQRRDLALELLDAVVVGARRRRGRRRAGTAPGRGVARGPSSRSSLSRCA